MAEFSSDERIVLRKLINIYPELFALIDPTMPAQQPQAAPMPKLVEAVEALLKEMPYKIDGCCSLALNEAINNFHRALAAEKRRQELWNKERDLLRANVKSSTLRWIDGQVDALKQQQPPQSAPVPKLVEACEAYFRASDVNHSFRPGTKLNYHGMDERETMRLALAAEKRRKELVENLIDAVRRFYQENDGRYDLLRVRLSELDAFDKECTV